MRTETPTEWARRVKQEIEAGKLEPDQPKAIDTTGKDAALRLAIEIGREMAQSRNLNLRERLRPYMISDDR